MISHALIWMVVLSFTFVFGMAFNAWANASARSDQVTVSALDKIMAEYAHCAMEIRSIMNSSVLSTPVEAKVLRCLDEHHVEIGQ